MSAVDIRPVTADNWDLLETLFAAHGTVRGCWCMYFRLTSREFDDGWGDGNREDMCRLVCDEGVVPGLIAVADGEAVGWVRWHPATSSAGWSAPVSPSRSTTSRMVDRLLLRQTGRPPWWPHPGAARAAVEYATDNGARLIEAYPYDTDEERRGGTELYYGVASTFREAGFEEVERRSPRRPIMRLRPREAEHRHRC